MSRLTVLRRRIENNHPRASSKGESHAIYRAIVNKKKLPEKKEHKSSKDPKFAKLSIAQYEKKYPTWD